MPNWVDIFDVNRVTWCNPASIARVERVIEIYHQNQGRDLRPARVLLSGRWQRWPLNVISMPISTYYIPLKTATPAPLLDVAIGGRKVQAFSAGSYASTVFRHCQESPPPTAISFPFITQIPACARPTKYLSHICKKSVFYGTTTGLLKCYIQIYKVHRRRNWGSKGGHPPPNI